MTVSFPRQQFRRASASAATARLVEGLPLALDDIAERAAPSHAFLRHGWFAAAVERYGGAPRTLMVERAGVPVLALPMVATGPRPARLATLPGSYWPFRSIARPLDATDDDFGVLVHALARSVRALRYGPVYDGDPGFAALADAARRAGWAVLPRFVAERFALDVAALRQEGPWPRLSTLRKNRYHEKHLGSAGAAEWSFAAGDGWDDALFDALADVEQRSWIETRTDGSDAKFTTAGHGGFWRAAARDPVIAAMMSAAMLRVDGRAMAFSFDLNAGELTYAIANSYDPAVARYSPGKLLYYRNLVRAVERGMAHVDWGAGDSGYKRTIGAEPATAIRDWLFLRPGWPARLAPLVARRWAASGNPPPAGEDQTRT